MRGTYHLLRDDGEANDVYVGPFRLLGGYLLN